jgi:hypothetical protein
MDVLYRQINSFKSTVFYTSSTVPEIIDPVFAKTSQNARFLLSENERFGACFRENWVYKFGHWYGTETVFFTIAHCKDICYTVNESFKALVNCLRAHLHTCTYNINQKSNQEKRGIVGQPTY